MTPPYWRNLFPPSRFHNPNIQKPLRLRADNMASRSNPNVPSKQRRLASRRKVQKKKAINKVTKNPRGTARSSVLYPTGGPLAPISKKKARKLERAQNHARARAIENAMEQEEAEMIGECGPHTVDSTELTKEIQMRLTPRRKQERRITEGMSPWMLIYHDRCFQ
jgi:hypothetical protein